MSDQAPERIKAALCPHCMGDLTEASIQGVPLKDVRELRNRDRARADLLDEVVGEMRDGAFDDDAAQVLEWADRLEKLGEGET